MFTLPREGRASPVPGIVEQTYPWFITESIRFQFLETSNPRNFWLFHAHLYKSTQLSRHCNFRRCDRRGGGGGIPLLGAAALSFFSFCPPLRHTQQSSLVKAWRARAPPPAGDSQQPGASCEYDDIFPDPTSPVGSSTLAFCYCSPGTTVLQTTWLLLWHYYYYLIY